MSLHIIIGFDSAESSARPFPVYVGRSGVDADSAMRSSTAARFERFSNVTGVRKNNPHRAANVRSAEAKAKADDEAKSRPKAKP